MAHIAGSLGTDQTIVPRIVSLDINHKMTMPTLKPRSTAIQRYSSKYKMPVPLRKADRLRIYDMSNLHVAKATIRTSDGVYHPVFTCMRSNQYFSRG